MKKLSLLLSLLIVLLFSGCSPTTDSASPEKNIKKVKKEYYTGGMLRSEYLMYDNTGMNGIRKHYGYEGRLTSVAEIQNGVKHGTEKWFDKKGRTLQTVPYVNGRIDGMVTKFYPNGDPMVTITYKRGFREGAAIKYKKDGNILEKTLFKNDQEIN